MQKKYGIKIDDDTIDFLSVSFDSETQLPKDNEALGLFNILSNTTQVLNISNLDYLPENGSVWDGESFSQEREVSINSIVSISGNSSAEITHEGFERFAFLNNNTLVGIFYYNKSKTSNEMLIAALSSSPEIVDLGFFE
jgi:hypothetical protein